MQVAVPAGQGAMAALLGATPEQAAAACAAADGLCEIANDNAPGQLVLSGEKAAVEAASIWARENGVKKAVPLPVSAPFHCSMMSSAAEIMRNALAEVEIRAPSVPLIANVTAEPCTDPDLIRAGLVAQVTGQVRWRESVEYIVGQGVGLLAEAGAGKVLTVMNRRTSRETKGMTLGTPEDLEAFAEYLNSNGDNNV